MNGAQTELENGLLRRAGAVASSDDDDAMRIAMIASECEPYAKTGGLADVVDALARGAGPAGHERRLRRRSTSICRATGLRSRRADAEPLDSDRIRPGLAATDRRLARRRRGRRLPAAARRPPGGFDRDGLYGYPRQRRALRAPGPRGARGDARSTAGRSTSSTSTTGSLGDPRPAASALRRLIRIVAWRRRAVTGHVPQPRLPRLGRARRRRSSGSPGDRSSAPAPTAWTCCARGSAADLVNTVSPGFARESLTPEFGAGVDDVRCAPWATALPRDHQRHRYGALEPGHGRGDPARYSRDRPGGQGRLPRDLCAQWAWIPARRRRCSR